MQGLAQDLRLAIRLLAKDRRFTIAAVVALGLGIGVTTTVFALDQRGHDSRRAV